MKISCLKSAITVKWETVLVKGTGRVKVRPNFLEEGQIVLRQHVSTHIALGRLKPFTIQQLFFNRVHKYQAKVKHRVAATRGWRQADKVRRIKERQRRVQRVIESSPTVRNARKKDRCER
jgi:hypothetical protein